MLHTEQLMLLFWEAMPRHPGTDRACCLPKGGLGTGLGMCSQCKEANEGPFTLRGEGSRNVSLLPPSFVETCAVYVCMFVRCNVMEGTLGHLGSSVCQELEAKKDKKIK